MKKVLFATTALVASAGIASAQGVALSGGAEIGIYQGKVGDIEFWHDIDVKFTLSGETDNGLTFGATIDLDEVSAGISAAANPSSVFLSGNFGTLTMGDTDGAFDWALREVGIGSAIADDHTTHSGFSGNSAYDGAYDGQIARYDYSFGDFGIAVSAELDDTGVGDPGFQIGAKWAGDVGGVRLGVGIGYGSADIGVAGASETEVGISLSVSSGGFTGILNYVDLGDSDGGGVSETHTAIGIGYTMDALTLSANWGQFEEGASTQSGYGIAVNYDLGGGAAVQFGYGNTDSCGVYAGCTTGDTFSLGVAMSF